MRVLNREDVRVLSALSMFELFFMRFNPKIIPRRLQPLNIHIFKSLSQLRRWKRLGRI